MPTPPRRERTLIAVLILAGLLLTILFGLRALHAITRIRHAGPPPYPLSIEDIQPWMTIPSIAQMYGVPAEELFAAIGAPPEGNEHKTIRELEHIYASRDRGRLLETIKRFLAERASHTPPAPEVGGG